MSVKKNILANYAGTMASAIMPVLALPWYLEGLGPEVFGLIGFITMLQSLLGLLDAGLSQSLVREFAVRLDATDSGRRRAGLLLFGFERIYWIFALSAGGLTVLLAQTIATHWLNLGGLPIELGTLAVYGAAAIFVAQFPGSVYRSLLIGAQAQIPMNVLTLSAALFRHVGGVLVVVNWPFLSVYLIWHTSIVGLETLVRAGLAWKTVNVAGNQRRWDSRELRPTWRFVASMSGAAWLGALTVQVDKIVLSRMVSIEQFGYYTIASTVAIGLLQLIYPMTQAVLPRAIQLRAEPLALRALSLKLLLLTGFLVAVSALIFMVAGDWLLTIWLRSPQAVGVIYPLLSILLMGTVLNAFYNVGYINWIVHEKIHRVFHVNLLALVFSLGLIPLLVTWQGAKGAAFGWLSINLLGFIASLDWLKRIKNETKH